MGARGSSESEETMQKKIVFCVAAGAWAVANWSSAQQSEQQPEQQEAPELRVQQAPDETEGEQVPIAPEDRPRMYSEAELQERIEAVVAAQDAQKQQSTVGSRVAGALSTAFNPAISANLVVYTGGTTRNEGADFEESGDFASGISLQEVEVRLSAIVGPYFRADFTLASDLDEIGFEEAFLSTLAIPHVTVRAGQMFAAIGKHNLLHTHAFPFLQAPLAHRALLGAEGARDVGVSADLLLPLPFFAEINAQIFAGEWAPFEGSIDDDPLTPVDESIDDQRRARDLAYLGHARALWDLSDETTLEIGGTYAGGRNGFAEPTHLYGGDLTFKWAPSDAQRYRSVEWQTEYLGVRRKGAPEANKLGGGHTHVRVQFAQRWWAQARAALLGLPRDGEPRRWRAEALAGFIPSELSALRLQYAVEDDGSSSLVHELFLQAIVSIGSHPAHAY